jgi:hypothetical protein
MADVATPSGAAMFDGGAQDKKKATFEKPDKPDEEVYKANLKKAEKEHVASMEKLVRGLFRFCSFSKVGAKVARQPAVTHTNFFIDCYQESNRARKAEFERLSCGQTQSRTSCRNQGD